MLIPHPSDESTMDCPAVYQYYDCAVSSFVGCCSIDACERPEGCPPKYQPEFQILSSPMASTIIISSSAVPNPTPPSETTTAAAAAVIPETITIWQEISTTSHASLPIQSPAHSTSPAPNTPAHPHVTHAGLIAGLAVALAALLLATAVFLCKLQRHRQIEDVAEDDVVPATLLPLRNLRRKKTAGAAAAAASRPAATTPASQPGRTKPAVPASLTEVQLLGRDEGGDDDDGKDDGRSPTGLNTPTSTAGAPTSRQSSIRAVPFSPSRAGAASDSSSRNNDRGGGSGGTTSAPGRGVSLEEDSFFLDRSPGRRGSGFDTTWVDSEADYAELRPPAEFHGLSAPPPRSREGPGPGSRGNLAG